jgi:hypothetical protein
VEQAGTMGLGFVAPHGRDPLGVRVDATWRARLRHSARLKRSGRCGCGRPKVDENHKQCPLCWTVGKVEDRGRRLREARMANAELE